VWESISRIATMPGWDLWKNIYIFILFFVISMVSSCSLLKESLQESLTRKTPFWEKLNSILIQKRLTLIECCWFYFDFRCCNYCRFIVVFVIVIRIIVLVHVIFKIANCYLDLNIFSIFVHVNFSHFMIFLIWKSHLN